MQNEHGKTRSFIVTRMDAETLTVDGNNPLCGRDVVFSLEVLSVREATDEEKRAGGAVGSPVDIAPSRLRPI
jgi:FKBP-type peptidyl-prolyl cis-trans isomerase SlyD